MFVMSRNRFLPKRPESWEENFDTYAEHCIRLYLNLYFGKSLYFRLGLLHEHEKHAVLDSSCADHLPASQIFSVK